MVVLLEVNTKEKYVYARKYTNRDAILRLIRINHIPPQDRYVHIIDYKLYDYYTYEVQQKIFKYFYNQLPDVNDIIKYKSFPVYKA